MKKTIYIVRHGETDYNKKDLVQGSAIDAPLNEVGLAQGQAFCKEYDAIPFQKIYTTELQRTWQTVDKLLQKGIPTSKLGGLNEMNYGVFEGLPINKPAHNDLLQVKEAWKDGHYNAKTDGGESPLDLRERQNQAIYEVLSAKDEELVLIAMHGRALRILLCWTLDKPLSSMDDFPMPNSCLYVLEYDYSTLTFTCKVSASTEHIKKHMQ